MEKGHPDRRHKYNVLGPGPRLPLLSTAQVTNLLSHGDTGMQLRSSGSSRWSTRSYVASPDAHMGHERTPLAFAAIRSRAPAPAR